MSYHFDVLCEVAEATVTEMNIAASGSDCFTAREVGEALHFAQPYLPPWDRYPRPLRRGACAGQVLRRLRQRGVVELVRPGLWRLAP